MTDEATNPGLLDDVRQYLANALANQQEVGGEDQAAWNRFFDVYNGILERFAAKLRFQSQERDDLVQDVWCRVIQDLPQYRHDASKGGFRRWLYTIVQCRAIDHARYRRARAYLKKKPVGGRTILHAANEVEPAEPAELLDREFKRQVVRTAIEHFRKQASPADWEVFELCRLQGLSGPAAAAKLGIPPATLRKRLERATARLRAAILDIVGPGDDLDV
jgi:RNA polymerase sigma-70 factor (ECF subfamily)